MRWSEFTHSQQRAIVDPISRKMWRSIHRAKHWRDAGEKKKCKAALRRAECAFCAVYELGYESARAAREIADLVVWVSA